MRSCGVTGDADAALGPRLLLLAVPERLAVCGQGLEVVGGRQVQDQLGQAPAGYQGGRQAQRSLATLP